MGVSTDAILCFGVKVDDDYDAPKLPWQTYDEDEESESGDFEEWFYRLNGVDRAKIWSTYEPFIAAHPELERAPHHQRMEAWENAFPGTREALDNMYAKQREVEESCPIELVMHCSYDYPMYIVAVRGTKVTASRGYPEVISLDGLGGDNFIERQIAAERFCEEHSIPFENPQWLLCSMWG